MHSFKVNFIADVAAWEKLGNNLYGKLEEILGQTSYVYEAQFNIQLVLAGAITVYKSYSGAPDYA
eukprot:4303990-Heterocapsa_arctica.AAC.1